MIRTSSPELIWLVATTLATATLWIPYNVQLILQEGPVAAIWDPFHEYAHEAKWAQRAKRAHANAVENLAIFAPLALSLHVLGAGTAITALACGVYFFARMAHFVVYVLAVPVVRTILFLVGGVCQFVLGATLLGWI